MIDFGRLICCISRYRLLAALRTNAIARFFSLTRIDDNVTCYVSSSRIFIYHAFVSNSMLKILITLYNSLLRNRKSCIQLPQFSNDGSQIWLSLVHERTYEIIPRRQSYRDQNVAFMQLHSRKSQRISVTKRTIRDNDAWTLEPIIISWIKDWFVRDFKHMRIQVYRIQHNYNYFQIIHRYPYLVSFYPSSWLFASSNILIWLTPHIRWSLSYD